MEIQAQTMSSAPQREPWNKGKLIGQKPPLRPKHVWSIRTRLQMDGRTRDLAMFNLAEIVTDQLDRTEKFYTKLLGFAVKARDRIERSGLGVPFDLVYLDLGATVIELISYEGAVIDPAPQNEHLGYRMIALETEVLGANEG